MKKQTFSQHFRLNKSQYELDFVDVPVNSGDIPLFIDPYAISRRIDPWSVECNNIIVSFFQDVVNCIKEGRKTEAEDMLSGLREPNQTCLGLSKGKRPRGRGVGRKQAVNLYKALAESSAVQTGFLKDLEDCELLIEGISRDKISDITTNIIRGKLIEYSQSQCALFDIKIYKVASGPIWDYKGHKWMSEYVDLPVCFKRSIILVPKAIARYDFDFSCQEYYQHFVLHFLQSEHLEANTSLVRVLKNGTRKPPTKKVLKVRHPLSKKYLYSFSKEHPEVLEKYKMSKVYNLNETTNELIVQLNEQDEDFDYDILRNELETIPIGDEGASRFHNHMKGVLEAIFYPYLIGPDKEFEVHEGRKRIDLVFENAAREGFFRGLYQIKQVYSPYIFIECKNYNSDPANRELDQLSGRFSKKRGEFGFLVCRHIKDKKHFYRMCKDTAQDGRGFIIPLDDSDIKQLLELRKKDDIKGMDKFLDEQYRKLVM